MESPGGKAWNQAGRVRHKKGKPGDEDEFEDDYDFGRLRERERLNMPKGRGLRQGLGDAMWITHLFPLICRKQRKTHGAVIHFREVKEAG